MTNKILASNEKYDILENEQGDKAITCKKCGQTSWNPGDVEYKFCPNCYLFIETMENLFYGSEGKPQ